MRDCRAVGIRLSEAKRHAASRYCAVKHADRVDRFHRATAPSGNGRMDGTSAGSGVLKSRTVVQDLCSRDQDYDYLLHFVVRPFSCQVLGSLRYHDSRYFKL